jgi:hypothetical protein
MGLAVASVGNGTITLSNGQKLQIGTGATAGAQPPAFPAIPGLGTGGVNPADPSGSVGASLGGVMTGPTPYGTGMGSDVAKGNVVNPDGTVSPAGPATPGGALNTASKTPPPGGPSQADLLKAYAAFHPPAPVDYFAQYDAALAASRGNLENQYVQAQGAIDKQQQDANATLMQVPGQFKTINDQRVAGTARETGTLLAADKAAGVGQGSGDALAKSQSELTAAGQQNNAGNKALVPSLGLGIKTQMDAERASLDAAHTTAQGALDAAAMNVEASRASQAQSEAYGTENQKAQDKVAADAATTAYNRQLVLVGMKPGPNGLNALSKTVPGMTNADEKAIAMSGYFTLVNNELNTGKMADGSKATPAAITKQVSGLNGNANIPGYNGSVATGLLQVLKSYKLI